MKSNVAALLRIAEAAQLLGISPASVRTAIAQGELRTVQAPGTISARGRRVTRSSIEAYLKRAEQGACR